MTAGVVLACLQLAFGLSWVAYAIHLPALAAQAGIAKSYVPWILLADQAIFVVSDLLAGIHADHLVQRFGRLGLAFASVSIACCVAFVAIPLVAPAGGVAMLAVIVIWSVTSSALRAPPLVLMGRHASKPQRPWLAGLYTLGMGLAGVLGPYASSRVVGADPRIVFAIASGVLVLGTIVIVAFERHRALVAPPVSEPVSPDPGLHPLGVFAVGFALLAIGYQIHAQVGMPAAYLRFAKQDELGDLVPIFWIGVAVLSVPAVMLAKHFGALRVIAVGGVLGVAATFAAAKVGSLGALMASQMLAGAAWGAMLSAAFVAAGTAGRVVGLVSSLIALATVMRIGLVAGGVTKQPALVDALPYLPVSAWAVGTLLTGALALRRNAAVTATRARRPA